MYGDVLRDKEIAIIGAGPAGLMAAETLARAGLPVTVYERKSSPARKFLLAGRGGLNITHSEDVPRFITRYGPAQDKIAPMIDGFTPADMRAWCHGLGEETFVGSSGRVFPKSFKASPLLRAWLRALDDLGVRMEYGMTWQGWDENHQMRFQHRNGETVYRNAAATILALGGGSWPNLGSDGGWVDILQDSEIKVSPLKPANCGFAFGWSELFKEQFAGQPLKAISLNHKDQTVMGEIMIDAHGLEGGAVYALSSSIRDEIETKGHASINIDLRPSITLEDLNRKLAAPRAKKSFSNYLRGALSLSPLEINLLREADPTIASKEAADIANAVKNVTLSLKGPFLLEKSISSAGGVRFDELTDGLMLEKLPGVFAAGEMLDWEAPTGGYLLQGCFASGVCAARGVLGYLRGQ